MKYNWQQPEWPHFQFDIEALKPELETVKENATFMGGVLKGLPDDLTAAVTINILVEESMKTSEIEGEYLSRQDVMSSIQKNLGLHTATESIKDNRARSITDLLHDMRESFADVLTKQKLFDWHSILFSYLESSRDDQIGKWRSSKDPMQVVSGSAVRPTIHFEAPPSDQVEFEMKRFVEWYNKPPAYTGSVIPDAAIHSGIAHLYFESIHPFHDGNGRIGRIISDKSLSLGLGRPSLMSLSYTIESDKKTYYSMLESTQRGNEITEWLVYFIRIICGAQTDAQSRIDFTIKKVKFFDRYSPELNERQRKILQRMLQNMPAEPFEGGMNVRKYTQLTGASKATVTRDLQQLEQLGIFIKVGDGRSTRYELASSHFE